MDYGFKEANLSNLTEVILENYKAMRNEKQYFSDSAMSNKITKDTLQKTPDAATAKNTCTDGSDDGKISFKEKMENFGIGLTTPVKNMFSSPKNIAITAVSAAACAGLIALTGGAAAPVMAAFGIIGGGIQIGGGIYKQITAKTDNEAQQAWQQMGSGTFTAGVSAASAKASLKASGVSNVKDTSILGAVVKCLKDLPSNLSKSVKTAGQNISGIISKLKSPAVQTIIVETSAANGSSSAKPTASDKPIIDVDFVEIVDTPDGEVLVPNNSKTGAAIAGTKSKMQTLIASAAETLKLGTKPKPLQIEAKPEPLRLEAPKNPDVTTSSTANTNVTMPDVQTSSQKHGIIGKIKNMLKVFGFFTSEE